MEQQATSSPASAPATSPRTRNRYASQASIPPKPSTTTRELGTTISTSVPSLRFPRPLGNHHLANWISKSDPDIMRVITAPAEAEAGLGLADSTYELVSADSDYQDDGEIDVGLASESEQSRRGNTSSTAGTDAEVDDTEEEDVERHAASDSSDSGDFETEDESDGEGETRGRSLPESIVDLTEPHEQEPESRSRAHSIEYTEHSLQLPSARTDEEEAKKPSVLDQLMDAYQAIRAPQFGFGTHGVRAAPSHSLSLYCTAIASILTLLAVSFFSFRSVPLVATSPAAPTVTSTVIINHTSVRTITISPTTAHTPAPAAVAPFSGILADLHDFGLRKNTCSAEVTPNKDVLVKMPASAKSTWLSRSAITLAVYKGERMLKSSFHSTDQGIVIQLGRKDAYGPVNVSIISSRRPYVNETFELDFGRGTLADAWEAGVHLVHDLAGLTAEGVRELRGSIQSGATSATGHAQDANVAATEAIRSFAASISSRISDRIATLAHELKEGEERAQVRLQGIMSKSDEILHEAEVAVLKAQITSRLWFYKMTNNVARYDDYNTKAKTFMENKRWETSKYAQAIFEAKAKEEAKCQPVFSSWARPECWKST